MMVMHYGQQITSELDEITVRNRGIDVKKHIGGGFYSSINSPYKNVGIWKWRVNSNATCTQHILQD